MQFVHFTLKSQVLQRLNDWSLKFRWDGSVMAAENSITYDMTFGQHSFSVKKENNKKDNQI